MKSEREATWCEGGQPNFERTDLGQEQARQVLSSQAVEAVTCIILLPVQFAGRAEVAQGGFGRHRHHRPPSWAEL